MMPIFPAGTVQRSDVSDRTTATDAEPPNLHSTVSPARFSILDSVVITTALPPCTLLLDGRTLAMRISGVYSKKTPLPIDSSRPSNVTLTATVAGLLCTGVRHSILLALKHLAVGPLPAAPNRQPRPSESKKPLPTTVTSCESPAAPELGNNESTTISATTSNVAVDEA